MSEIQADTRYADPASSEGLTAAPARRRETMAFDFSRLASSGAIADITQTATLFDALPNKANGYEQATTLRSGSHRDRSDRPHPDMQPAVHWFPP
jgi:hypothetical protein